MRSKKKAPALKGRRARRAPAYGPSERLFAVRAMLDSPKGATLVDIAERFSVSTRTALRYLQALERAGVALYEETTPDRRKLWCLEPQQRRTSLVLSGSQMIALYLSRRVFDFLEGTDFKSDLDGIFDKLEKLLARKDFTAIRNLDRKLWDMNEAPHDYSDRKEDVRTILSAILREERLRVTHGSVEAWKKPFEIDPYSLLVWKKGLYLAGYSHHRGAIRTFPLDSLRDVKLLKGHHFEYPTVDAYHPRRFEDGYYGLEREPRTPVRLRFLRRVGRFVERRKWHPTQQVTKRPEFYEVRMEVHGLLELKTWLLGFGDTVEVLEPLSLRAELRAEHLRAAALNEGEPPE